MSHFFISAAHKSSGKTTLSIALCALLREQQLKVQPFKKGPDYIDPIWLKMASGNPCYNLDFHTMKVTEITRTFQHSLQPADIAVIEGNKGLYDSVDLAGKNSNAALAKLLKSPVILVIDSSGITRGIAPLLMGYQQFDKDTPISGVILNKVAGSRHESKLQAAVEYYTDLPIIGSVYRNPELCIKERHLGLIPGNESTAAQDMITRIRDLIKPQVDLEKLQAIAKLAATTAPSPAIVPTPPVNLSSSKVRIAIAKDPAFGFYYPDDLQALEKAGAELIPFNTFHDTHLPKEADGLFIGGGFPETQLSALSANHTLKQDIFQFIEAGKPAYAECGGLMYLCRSIQWQQQTEDMVGIIPADIQMHEKPVGRGYVTVKETDNHPWPRLNTPQNLLIQAHEFHYSALTTPLESSCNFAYTVERGVGINGQQDGFLYKNLLASYIHLRNTTQNPWAKRFVQFINQVKNET
jgi:cobyrinic acid a,c-diamide synthase